MRASITLPLWMLPASAKTSQCLTKAIIPDALQLSDLEALTMTLETHNVTINLPIPFRFHQVLLPTTRQTSTRQQATA